MSRPRSSLRLTTVPLLFFAISVSALLAPMDVIGEITTEGLKKTESKVRELARKTLPATVSLIPGGPARRFGTGSGVIVSEDGLILTAAHVSMEMNEKVTVIFPDGKRATGKVLGMDYTRDSGMIQITDKGKKFPFVELGDSKALKENDWCVALGHAGGYQSDRTPPVRLGRVIRNDPKKFLMTDSALIGGDSGGPLFDIDGKLIGIHSNIGFSLSQNNHVPISTFVENWDRLKSGERYGGNEEGGLISNPDRPMIGAVLVDPLQGIGAVIDEVFPKSPASKAGLKKGDRIVQVDDLEVKNTDSLIAVIRSHKAGEKLDLVVKPKDEDEEKEVSIELAPANKIQRRPRSRGPAGNPLLPVPRSPKEKKALQDEFNKKMRESIEKGELRLSEADMKKFRSPSEFMEYMEKFKKSLTNEELEKLVDLGRPPESIPIRPGVYDPDLPIQVGEGFFREVLDAFRPSVAKASDSTHLVFRGREWKSLCTVVHEDGYVVTKASEIETENNQKLTVMLSKEKQVPAEIVKTFPKYDLALLKLEDTTGLTPVYWDSAGEKLPLGSFLSAASSGPDPVAIGLVSVKSRSMSGETKGFLGIRTAPHEDGVKVTGVLEEGNAGKAGVKEGDIITKINDAVCDTPEKLIKQISGTKPGEDVILHFIRKGKEAALKVKLGDRSKVEAHRPDPSARMNRMGTDVSEKSSGFTKVLQTDLPIMPQQCGGPVVDLEGNVIGINIARAGRIKTYALPAAEVKKLLEPELEKLLNSTTQVEPVKGPPTKPVEVPVSGAEKEPAAPQG